ncbi:similar to Saccharomyces cerevisiae YHR185C PFS1 Sporulation protein required for prospore membrane formation at selected spindle poles [Maudiozyma saulgeensis]|uniref:Similar to Saccharomyces cerevisiae YHR185C PFS1 Sporulation protein required for prospore membrane formation at selected spindle poles n=1 Tax=Maudiozyma saulgeensis TaxID=1789683 RepID=A0A1X7RAT7_9SACH|nr:similar to Saccharomyces cerevisiae YHR185C PFS1 Sporulation protein required for prospore membrane formation at selected spindle poles [Kazachstania saulgeensis]
MPNKFEFNNAKPFTPHNYRQVLESCPNTNWVSHEKYTKHQKPMVQSRSSPPLRTLNNFQSCDECNANLFEFHQNVFSNSQKLRDTNPKTQTMSNSPNMFGSNTYLANTDNMIPSYNNFIGYPVQSNGMIGMTSGGLLYNNHFIHSNDYPLQKDYHPPYNGRNNIHNMMNSYQRADGSLNNICKCPEDILSTNGSFPTDFDPRGAKDMPAKEKVTNWIDNIPIYEIRDNIWNNDCFPNDYSLNWDEVEFDRKNNQFLTRDQNVSLTNSDELIFLQSKKIDCLVRLVYNLEKEQSNSKNNTASSQNENDFYYQDKRISEDVDFDNNFEIGFS